MILTTNAWQALLPDIQNRTAANSLYWKEQNKTTFKATTDNYEFTLKVGGVDYPIEYYFLFISKQGVLLKEWYQCSGGSLELIWNLIQEQTTNYKSSEELRKIKRELSLL